MLQRNSYKIFDEAEEGKMVRNLKFIIDLRLENYDFDFRRKRVREEFFI